MKKVLSRKELFTPHNVDTLLKTYMSKGLTFTNLEEAIPQIKTDCTSAIENTKRDQNILSCTLGNKKYVIHGIMHYNRLNPTYFEEIKSKVGKNTCYYELNLASFFGAPSFNEMLDIHALNVIELIRIANKLTISCFMETLSFGVMEISNLISPKVGLKDVNYENAIQNLKKIQKSPLELFGSRGGTNLPVYVVEEFYKNLKDPHGTRKRSSYMAAFLKHEPSELTEVHAIVGAAHASEIYLDLLRDTYPKGIETLAKKHTNLMKDKPKNYQRKRDIAARKLGLYQLSSAYAIMGSAFGMGLLTL